MNLLVPSRTVESLTELEISQNDEVSILYVCLGYITYTSHVYLYIYTPTHTHTSYTQFPADCVL